LTKAIEQLLVKYQALNTRERWVVFFAGIVVIYGIFNVLLLAPALEKQQRLQAEVVQSQSEITEIQQQVSMLAQTPIEDVDTQNKSKIVKLSAKVDAQKAQLSMLNQTLVSPERMLDLLKSLIRNDEEILLVSMKTLPAENFLNQSKQESEQVANASKQDADMQLPVIYRHGLELTLSGKYMALMRYTEALEKLSQQVLWDKAVLKTKEYPVNELTITVYTLSLDKTWLSI
jgi:MSHA biogenesis protein MshJ